MLIQVGDHEILISDAVRLAEKARQAGMWHLWHAFAGLIPESQKAIDIIGAIVNKNLSQ